MNLINCAVNFGVKAFVFTSSIAVYGSGQVPMTEDVLPMSEDSYGIAKYAVELDLKESYRMFRLPYIIFWPHNVYGGNQNIGDPYRNVIGIFINQIMRGQPMTIFGGGTQTRAFVHIGDVAPVVAAPVENPRAYGQVFNVGADTPFSVMHLAEVVAKAMGVSAKVVHLETRKEVVHAYASYERLREVFEAKACISLEEGVERMAQWAKSVGPRKSKASPTIEVRKNLPPSWQAQAVAK